MRMAGDIHAGVFGEASNYDMSAKGAAIFQEIQHGFFRPPTGILQLQGLLIRESW